VYAGYLYPGTVNPASPGVAAIDLSAIAKASLLDKAFEYIRTDSGSAYTIVAAADFTQNTALTLNRNGVSVTLTTPGSTPITITKPDGNNLFAVGGNSSTPSNAKLTLAGRIVLKGIPAPGSAGRQVYVMYGGQLVMKDYAEITGNTSTESGGGVRLTGIEGAVSGSAGRSTFTMSDNAKIYNNYVKRTGNGAQGGGVYAGYGDITINGNAQITGNGAQSTNSYAEGGGVFLSNSTLTMAGTAKIGGALSVTVGGVTASYTGNSSSANGTDCIGRAGGVFVSNSSTFNMKGGNVSGNIASGTASGLAGGVYVNGSFFMSGGTISGNTAVIGSSLCKYGTGIAQYGTEASPGKWITNSAGEADTDPGSLTVNVPITGKM
jgi:hypothetical protein